jgi:hypothetical protein
MNVLMSVIWAASLAASTPKPTIQHRGISAGTWNTIDFSAPQFVSRWGHGDTNGAHNVISVDPSVLRNGKPTIKLETNAGFDNWVYFPNTRDLDIDLSKSNALRFFLKSVNKNGWGGDPWIIFVDMQGNKARYDGFKRRLYDATKDWAEVVVPVGLDVIERAVQEGWKVKFDPGFDWKHVACVQIHQDTDGFGYTIWYSGFEFTGIKPLKWWLSSLQKPDMSVTYAEQVPLYRRFFPNYDKKYPELLGKEATEKHWPTKGEKIKYRVHVKNVGFTQSKPTDFICRIDGKVVKKARIPALRSRQETIVTVPWSWKQGPYDFVASVDNAGKMDEIAKKNNKLSFKTDAFTIAAVCEKSIVAPLDKVNSFYGSFSFEDWMRGATVDRMNSLFKHSRYDFAPNRAEISVRIDKIHFVDELPNDCGPIDRKLNLDYIDGTWHYPLRAIDEWTDLANDFDWALIHELTHQLGIIDDYQFDLGADRNKINGKPFSQPEGGIMGGGHIGANSRPAYADIDVAGMNATKGYRRGYFGDYVFCIPEKNTLAITLNGKPLADAEVSVYQKDMDTGDLAGPAVHQGKTDSQGRFVLQNRPVPKEFTTATGCKLHANPFGYPDVVGRNGLFMVRATVNGKNYYAFIDIGHFVVEYARGHQDATYPLELIPE